MLVIAGMDLSINSSGIVKFYLDENFNVIKKDFIGFTTVKKNERDNVVHYKKKQFNHYFDQNHFMLDNIIDFAQDVDILAIEDYAFAATGRLFHIGEFIGLIKHKLYSLGKKIRLYDPGTIKIFASGRGNCDKITMFESFLTYNNNDSKIDISDLPIVETTNGKSPTSDVVDAFFIAELLRTELGLRADAVALTSLEDNVRKVFERITKANPTTILKRDFIAQG